MKEVKKITQKIVLLVMDILVFTYQIVRKVIVPTRRRKGNILSSLLSFFVGLIERLLTFEESIFRQSFVCKYKYVKQALILAATFLFLLSSVEWTVGKPFRVPGSGASVPGTETPAVIIKEGEADAIRIPARWQEIAPVPITTGKYFITTGKYFTPGYVSNKTPVSKTPRFLAEGTIAVKRWLLYCVFRV